MSKAKQAAYGMILNNKERVAALAKSSQPQHQSTNPVAVPRLLKDSCWAN